jgi:DNA-binding CsgD family transcriptional regulator
MPRKEWLNCACGRGTYSKYGHTKCRYCRAEERNAIKPRTLEVSDLTSKSLTVFLLRLEGLTIKEIADRTVMNEKTVGYYLNQFSRLPLEVRERLRIAWRTRLSDVQRKCYELQKQGLTYQQIDDRLNCGGTKNVGYYLAQTRMRIHQRDCFERNLHAAKNGIQQKDGDLSHLPGVERPLQYLPARPLRQQPNRLSAA